MVHFKIFQVREKRILVLSKKDKATINAELM